MNASRVVRAWVNAARDFFLPEILLLSFLCFVGGLLLWGLVIWQGGPFLLSSLTAITNLNFDGFWGNFLLVLVSFPLVLLLGLLLLSFLAFPWVRRVMRKKGLKGRIQQGRLPLGYQFYENIRLTLLGLLSWMGLLLFLWLPLAPAIVSFVILAWIQWRLLALDFWGETEGRESYDELIKKHRIEGWVLSAGPTMLAFVPFVQFYFPVLSALAFMHWDQELQNEEN